jgi:DNA-binding SARP family transcriptional activator
MVLGQLHISYTPNGTPPVDLAAALTARPREVVLYLAAHREGAQTSMIANAIWPGATPPRPSNVFHSTLSQLRRCVRALVEDEIAELIVHRDGRYHLNPDLVGVDLWRLTTALHAARTATGNERAAMLQEVVDLYRGDLAQDYTGEWLDEPRETLRRDVIDAHAALIKATRQHDPARALGLLERARQLDPLNEAIYRDIMRMQSRLGHFDAISRTLRLLRTALADIDARPSTSTETLAVHLQHAPRPATTPDERRTA